MKIGDIYYSKHFAAEIPHVVVAIGPEHVTIKYDEYYETIKLTSFSLLTKSELKIYRKQKRIDEIKDYIDMHKNDIERLEKELKKLEGT